MNAAINRYLSKHGYSKFDLRTVFFDMDGILFNSMPHHAAAWVRVMQELGLRFNEQDAYMNEGRTADATIEQFYLKEQGRRLQKTEKEAIHRRKTEFFEAMGAVEPMNGVAEVLQLFKSQGLDIYVVTGSATKTLIGRLEHAFPGIFDARKMITAYDVVHGKPSPEPYQKGLAKAGIKPWQGLVIENAPLGVQSAVAADIFTIAVNTGPLPPQVLADAGADAIFPDMETLLQAWKTQMTSLFPHGKVQTNRD